MPIFFVLVMFVVNYTLCVCVHVCAALCDLHLSCYDFITELLSLHLHHNISAWCWHTWIGLGKEQEGQCEWNPLVLFYRSWPWPVWTWPPRLRRALKGFEMWSTFFITSSRFEAKGTFHLDFVLFFFLFGLLEVTGEENLVLMQSVFSYRCGWQDDLVFEYMFMYMMFYNPCS